MRIIFNTLCCVIAIALASATAQAQLAIGDVAGFDFESPAPVEGPASVGTDATTNFNLFDTQAADGTTVMQSGFVDLTGTPIVGLGLEVTNNLGKDTGLTGATPNPTTVEPFNQTSIYSDSYGAGNIGNEERADFGLLTNDSNIVLTFTGLDDDLSYNVTGGGAFNNENFDTIWTAGDVSATTDSDSTTGGEFATLSGLNTDGNGNLTVTVTRANVQILFTAVTIEAVEAVERVELVEQFAVGFDFESPAPVFPDDGSGASVGTDPTTNFNLFDTQAADGTTVMQSGFVDLTGAPMTGLGLEVTNNLGKDTGLTGVASNPTTVSPFNDISIYSDNYGAANVGNEERPDFGVLTDDSNIVLTFTGLDDDLCYRVTGGGAFNNNNFDTVWTAGDVSATTNSDSTTGGEFVTLAGLETDGSGNLAVTVTRANVQILFTAVTIAGFEKVDDNFGLGDVNQDGIVNFLDISPFILVLSMPSQFQFEADTNQDGVVSFLDISPFIVLLAGGA